MYLLWAPYACKKTISKISMLNSTSLYIASNMEIVHFITKNYMYTYPHELRKFTY